MTRAPLLLVLLPTIALCRAALGADFPPLENPASLPAQSIAPGKEARLALPALPQRPKRVAVLRFRAVIVSGGEGGCNYNAAVAVNENTLGARTATGDRRLLGRDSSFELGSMRDSDFPVFGPGSVMVMYAPDIARGDAMATDGLGATFALDISDIARGADGNTVTFRNILTHKMPEGLGALRVEGIEVGWLDRAALPRPKTAVPTRGAVASHVTAGGITLSQSTRGGFTIRTADGPELLVETAMSAAPGAVATLIADDGAPQPPDTEVTVRQWGQAGFEVAVTWPDLQLTRTVALRNGLLEWKERWTNTGAKTRGVPFRHRFFLRQGETLFRLGGAEDTTSLAGSAANPTLFLEAAQSGGAGFGVTAESDWLRLLMGLRARLGIGELFTDTLALAPKCSLDCELSIAPVRESGYWSFLNGVRQRWGASGITQERPVFWGYARATGPGTAAEKLTKSLGHLGPIYVVLGPWQRLQPDTAVVTSGQYPKLPADAPRAPGGCPDFDVDAFITFAHREPAWQGLQQEVAAIRKAAPQAKVMQMLHPAMETIYKPLEERWPFASEGIRTADGKVFEDDGYSKTWLGDMTKKDWGVLYYVPRPGSNYLAYLLASMTRALDEVGLDGLYSDEFSWAYNTRGYSRYDYSRWDGYSADLDAAGNVVRLKSDNAAVTESCQLQIISTVLRRGKFFLNNGGNVLRSVCGLPHARFVEGGNGPATMPQAHLSPTPLILGNMGDEGTLRGVMASVRACIAEGCVYSPTAVNLLLNGPDNFVCKQYPLTVQELGPGWIIGTERVITTVSRTFAWPARDATVRVYRYDAGGKLLAPPADAQVRAGALTLQVPPGGLAIAERR